MKFNSEATQGGYKILSLHRGESLDSGIVSWAGVIEDYHGVRGMTWDADGASDGHEAYNLIPLGPTVESRKWRNIYNASVSPAYGSRVEADARASVTRICVVRIDILSDGTCNIEKENI